MNEFSVIERFFKSIASNHTDLVQQSIGDDAAVLAIPEQKDLLISTDTLVENVHFLKDWPAEVIAYKALMTNISDIAAMAGTPCSVVVALTLPEIDQQWLAGFSKGLNKALQQYQIDLVGGDITRGPLTITITIHGIVPKAQAVLRSGAKVGDAIYLTGSLGSTGFAVSQLASKSYNDSIFNKLFFPKPCVEYAEILQKFATSAIDISDGLSSDLAHVLKASQVGAEIEAALIPVSPLLEAYLDKSQAIEQALHSGDEYELCFTVSQANKAGLEQAIGSLKLPYYHIGQIQQDKGLRVRTLDGVVQPLSASGFKHF